LILESTPLGQHPKVVCEQDAAVEVVEEDDVAFVYFI
jgi:hypothetical protein